MEEKIKELGFAGKEGFYHKVIPIGEGSEIHLEHNNVNNYDVCFTKGDMSGVPGKDYVYIYVAEIETPEQLESLTKALNL